MSFRGNVDKLYKWHFLSPPRTSSPRLPSDGMNWTEKVSHDLLPPQEIKFHMR